MRKEFPTRRQVSNAPGYEHVTTIRRALTAIEDELAGDAIPVVIGAKCEEITEALAQIWTRDKPNAD